MSKTEGQPLVSLVMPAFNREDYIAETLDSIINQSYTNWECIIIDDGSTDKTAEIAREYSEKDSRFRLVHRPDNRQKGPSACRNIGLENANGDFINFFDSDDIMLPHHIEFKVNKLLETGVDFVITKTKKLNAPNDDFEHYYGYTDEDISALNFILLKARFITWDICMKREPALKAHYNEVLQYGDEFNYFIKFLLITNNGKIYDEVAALRRMHNQSIYGKLAQNEINHQKWVTNANLYTLYDVRDYAPQDVKVALISTCIKRAYNVPVNIELKRGMLGSAVKQMYGLKGWLQYKISFMLRNSRSAFLKNLSQKLKVQLLYRIPIS